MKHDDPTMEPTNPRNGNTNALNARNGFLESSPSSITLSPQAVLPVTTTSALLLRDYSVSQTDSRSCANPATKQKQQQKENKEMKLKNQLRIPSALSPRGVFLSSLRPGDWLQNLSGVKCYVMVNGSVTQRAVVKFEDDKHSRSYPHVEFINCTYLGRGKVRWWWERLPLFLQERINQYTQP